MSERSFRIHDLQPYVLGEIGEAVLQLRASGAEVIDFSQVNPDFGPPSSGVDHVVQATLRAHNHRYSASRGITGLREAIAAHYEQRYGVALDPEQEVISTIGTKEGLSHLLLSVLTPGESIVLPMPSYPIHSAAAFIAGAGVIGVPLFSADEEQPSVLSAESSGFFERLETLVTRTWPRPRLMIFSFPHNPTTTVVDLSFFERLVRFAQTHELLLVHDFAYADICFEGYAAPSLLQVPGARDLGVEFYSLSKSFNVPGWRIGFCLGNPKLVSALRKIKSYVDSGVFQPLQIAALKLLNNSARGASIAAETAAAYQSRRDVLVEGLRDIGWPVSAPKGTVFVWAKIPELREKLMSRDFARSLLEEAKVAVCPGEGFSPEAVDWVRFALVEREARIRNAVRAISEYLQPRVRA